MKTIAEVLAENPECKEFVDERGRDWVREENLLNLIDGKHPRPWHREGWDDCCIPGLRPKPIPCEVDLPLEIIIHLDAPDVYLERKRGDGYWDVMPDNHVPSVYDRMRYEYRYRRLIGGVKLSTPESRRVYETSTSKKPREFWLFRDRDDREYYSAPYSQKIKEQWKEVIHVREVLND